MKDSIEKVVLEGITLINSTVADSPAPQDVASKGYVLQQVSASGARGECRPVITVSQGGIGVSKFKLYDVDGDVLLSYEGGMAEPLGCCFLSLAGILFLYVYAVSNDGLSTKVVATSKFENPAGFKYIRRLGCYPVHEISNTLIEGVQYEREFFFKTAMQVFDSNITGNLLIKLKYIPDKIPVKAEISGQAHPRGGGGNLHLNSASVAYANTGVCGQGYYYSGLIYNATLSSDVTGGATLFVIILIASYLDVTL